MIFAIYRSLFVLVVLEQIAIHANHIRHHHDSRLRHKFNVDDYVNDNFYNNLKSSVDTSAASEDEDYYDYMNDLENQEEEVAVGDDDAVRSRSHSNFYDYDKDNAYDYLGDEAEENNYPNDEPHTSAALIQRHKKEIPNLRSSFNPNNVRRVNDDKQRLGTRAGVEEEFYEHRGRPNVAAANAYQQYIFREWSCKHPRPKLIHVQNNPDTTLTPHCVVLHRCGSDTGCCDNASTCFSVKSEIVNITLMQSQMVRIGSKNLAKTVNFQFLNHTECACHIREPCQCPENFVAVQKSKDNCSCECLLQNELCFAQRNGTTKFSHYDKLKIKENVFQKPPCIHGNYSIDAGRCPMSYM